MTTGTFKLNIPLELRPWQKRASKQFKRFTTIVAHRRAGKQTTLETVVATPKGQTTIGQLKEGDYVIGLDGQKTKVLQLHEINSSKVFKVITKGGTIECCKDHQWTISTKYNNCRKNKVRIWETVSTLELKNLIDSGKHVILPKPKATKYKWKNLKIDPYIFGLWLGDGCKDNFRICGIDNEIHESVTSYLKDKNLKSKIYINNSGVSYSHENCGKGYISVMSRLLKELKVFKNKHIPDDYIYSSVKQREELIRGLMDSDGTTGLTKSGSSRERFSNTNINILNGFRKILASLGIESTIRAGKGTEKVISFKSTFNPFRLKRKSDIYTKPRKSYIRVLKVEETNITKPMRCITVDAKDSLYLIGDHYIPTHNTILNIYKQLEYIFSLNLPGVAKRAAYVAPTYAQAKDIAWGYFKEFLKECPEEVVKFNESELKIKFFDGTIISLYGAENYDNMRGIYLNHCILDEYQKISPNALSKVILPTLRDHKGHLILTGTPNGKNDFYYRYLLGQNEETKDWSASMYDIYNTNVFSEEEIKEIRDIEYKYKPEDYKQEYECCFEAAARGSIFGKEVSKLKQQERIVDKEYDPSYPVVAALDIGFDGTGIWYVQKVGKQLIIIDMDFYKDEDIAFTANKMLGKRYTYDHIILPHDGVKRSIVEKEKTAKGQLQRFGFKVRVAKRLPIMDAIAATRLLLNKSQITKRCTGKRFKFEGGESTPLDALSLYQFKVDDEGHSREQEKHDDASHIGSALRTLAVGLRIKFSDNFDVETRSKFQYALNLKKKIINQWNPYKRK